MAKLRGFQKLTPIDEALKTFLSTAQIGRPKAIVVSLNSALNRVLANEVTAPIDLPRFDRSAVDGYAVKAEDTDNATLFRPKALRITNEDAVGGKQARQVWTGNPIPKHSNAVMMIENTRKIEDKIEVWNPVTPGENVSKRGEDIREGEVAAGAGSRLRPQHLGLIGALGVTHVKVFERPRIGILATGNELAELGSRLSECQTFNVNTLILSSLCCELGAEPLDLGIVADDTEEITRKLRVGLKKAEAVVTSGGTSVGGPDLVPECVNRIGRPGVIVHGVAMRPAMPTALAVADGKPIIVLPGNSVAAMIGFEVFARPLICRLAGLKTEESRFMVQAKTTRRITAALGRRTFVRVSVFQQEEKLFAKPISARGSNMLSTMTKANGYVIVPENREGLEEGEQVSVLMFDKIEKADRNVQKASIV